MLKAELHAHINEDPKDKSRIVHSARELVDEAIKNKFDVLAITCHNQVYEDKKLKEYAAKKGLLLLFGVERDIENKHVLLYKVNQKEADAVKTFSDLEKLRKEKNIFVIAAHPSYPDSNSLGKKIYQYPHLFDAWEYSFLHTIFWNSNRKMVPRAKEYQKPIVGNSDIHLLKDLGRTYSLIDSLLDEDAVFKAIKENKIKVITHPLSVYEFTRIVIKAITSALKHKIKLFFS